VRLARQPGARSQKVRIKTGGAYGQKVRIKIGGGKAGGERGRGVTLHVR
jgi:hypothetical protein